MVILACVSKSLLAIMGHAVQHSETLDRIRQSTRKSRVRMWRISGVTRRLRERKAVSAPVEQCTGPALFPPWTVQGPPSPSQPPLLALNLTQEVIGM
jgi:hypothetical protein